ncbi:MAG: TlpA family protein disulfide reductase [Gammaproteobacteria bacterium]|nr:MAG: TlpA family protein disulfide reductase [Gammaproteobacteria bacterium]
MSEPHDEDGVRSLGMKATLLVAAIMAVVALLWIRSMDLTDTSKSSASALDDPAVNAPVIGRPRPDFSLPDLDGQQHGIGEWDGKVVLLNFWATWCPPCQKEIPDFMQVRKELGDRGFEVVGVAIDQHDAVADYVDGLGIPYPILQGEADAAEVARRYGNSLGGLPYSVIIDREGRIRYARARPLNAEQLRALVAPLLRGSPG